MSQLSDALFTVTQQKVLGLLYANPKQSFYTKEIIRLTGMGVATIKRELDRMLNAGILTMTKIGNQHHYQANPTCPVYEELLSISKKTFGLVDIIKEALHPIKDKILWSFIFGSVASNKETSQSDIDIILIGEVGFSEVVQCLYQAQTTLSREINPKVYSQNEWLELTENKNGFIKEVLDKPRLELIGSEHEPG
jgi:predicted nucleotidyltransferase